MPRANRYVLAGRTFHVTHRCHDRRFLFKFGVCRTEYRRRLRLSLKRYDLSLLAYCITSNHTHLLINAASTEALSALMQQLEGEFAEWYNRRKRRSGAFWDGRYHATMIDGGRHLWNCIKYIDLNMVRAGVVAHPEQWAWCGYDELVGKRRRYRLVDRERLLELAGGCDAAEFAANYAAMVLEDIERGRLARDPCWSESIAVGDEAFVAKVEGETWNRSKLERSATQAGRWTLRETGMPYTVHSTEDALRNGEFTQTREGNA